MRYHYWTYHPASKLPEDRDTEAGVGSFTPRVFKKGIWWEKLAINNNFFCRVEREVLDLMPNICDRRTVVVAEDGVSMGVAILHPNDPFDKRDGRNLAHNRALM
jgi:hypothetical protein